MTDKLIEIEQNRLRSIGYESVVTPFSVEIDESLVQLNIGNNTCILTGIRLSPDDVLSNKHEVVINSATESLQFSQQEIATLGTSIYKLMKEYIIVRTTDENEYSGDTAISPFRLDFIKITPIKADKK